MTAIGGTNGGRDGADDGALALDKDGESLPWLESADDFDEERGFDSNRLIAFLVGGVALLVLLIGLVWWLTNRGPDPELAADGSLIEAPKEPYKTRPDDPGGKTFAGTGDTSFAVGEGQTREGRLAEADRPAAPTPPAPAIAAGGGEAAAPAPVKSGVAVQVGAFSTEAGAREGWQRLVGRHEVLQGVSHRIVEGSADIGKVYRLQALAGDRAGAEQLCATLKAQGSACQVK